MIKAVYIAIFLHYARKTIRKISESKEDWAKSLSARMEENGLKIYRDIYRDMYADMPYKVVPALRYLYTDDNNGSVKSAYEIVKDLVKQKYPSITAKS